MNVTHSKVFEDEPLQQQHQQLPLPPADITATYNDTFQIAAGVNITLLEEDQWLSEKIVNVLITYYMPILVCTGSIGNILSVLVFFKTKLRKLSSSYYLAALGVSDTCFLLIAMLNMYFVTFYNQRFFCQLFTYLSGVCSFLSVWFVVAFTVERFIAVLYPLKRQTMCTVRRAKIVLCGLTIAGAILNIPLCLYSDVIYAKYLNATLCDVMEENKLQMKIFNYVDTALVFVLPLTSIIILNTITGFTVWRVAGIRRTMTLQKRKTISTNCHGQMRQQQTQNLTVPKCLHPNGNHSIRQSCPRSGRQRIANSSQMKVTKMLLIVSTVFVCLNMPSYVMRLRAFIETKASRTTVVTQYFCNFFFMTNFGINFVLYCVSGQNFRKAILSMFKKATNHQRQEGATQVTVSEYIRSTGSNASRRRTVTRNGSWNDVHELHLMTSIK